MLCLLSVCCQFPLCSAMYFSLCENMMCSWECHCLSVMATVTKGAGLWRWSSLQNTRSRGRGWIQIQLLPPYIYLNLPTPSTTPWSPKPTNLHPLDVDPTPLPGSLFCIEGLLGLCERSIAVVPRGRKTEIEEEMGRWRDAGRIDTGTVQWELLI